MMYERCYFWSFDITTKTWTNEACYTQSQGLGFISNMPSPRSEAPVTQFGGGRYTLVHGGYSTLVPHYQPPYMIRCSYLSDTFLYDTETKRWKIISTDNFPQHRGGHAIVYVPPSEPSDRKGKLMGGGKALLFGGYKGGATTELLPFSEVWELTLQSSLKQVSATCHCCGKFFGPGGGLKKCTGTCDGAVVLCSEECRQKNWEVHKLWCRKKRDMVATPSEQTEE